ncbi:hypothetical protein [Methylocystis sp.]|uniref:hypothetical protein n=1 Tax=Methylocystis sp. TaxID=1911079 RepID=UPI003D0CE99B
MTIAPASQTISDVSQLSALQTAINLARGRVRLTRAEQELFERHIGAIHARIERAAIRREANGPDAIAIVETLLNVCPGGAVKDRALAWLASRTRAA